MKLQLTKSFERDRNSLITLDNVERGILADRILLGFFPPNFCGEISESQAQELLCLLEKQAREQLLRYLAEREHSSHQCRDFLRRKHYPLELIDRLLSEFGDQHYLDDARYARLLITSLSERGKSKRAIITKLRESRLPASLWEDELNELFDPAQSLENLKEQVLKLRLRYAGLPKEKQKQKVFASLFRKGYDLDDIQQAWKST